MLTIDEAQQRTEFFLTAQMIEALRAVWKRPIRVGEPVQAAISMEAGCVRARAEVEGRTVLTLEASVDRAEMH